VSDGAHPAHRSGNDPHPPLLPRPRGLLLNAAIEWNHAVLRAAVERLVDAPAGGLASVKLPAIADWIENRPPRTPLFAGHASVIEADRTLDKALSLAAEVEPLARLVSTFGLDPIEARLFFLALGPEFDPRYQRWISLLLDDSGRRVGTLGLFAELLGDSYAIASHAASSEPFTRWRRFETKGGAMPAADEPLRVDAPLRLWLLGGEDGLSEDPTLRGLLHSSPWPGSGLIDDVGERERAKRIVGQLRYGSPWLLLAGDGLATWRALIETGAAQLNVRPLRADLGRLAELDWLDFGEAGVRLARLARLSRRPLALDASAFANDRAHDERLGRFLTAIGSGHCPAAIITPDPARIAALLGAARYEIEAELPSGSARVAALQSAATGAGAHFTREAAESLANLFPLQIDGFEQALRIAQAQPHNGEDEESGARGSSRRARTSRPKARPGSPSG